MLGFACSLTVGLVDLYKNLNIICNVRVDSVMHALPPGPTGKPGRPKTKGNQLSVTEDFTFQEEKLGNFHVAAQEVLTNLFGKRVVQAFVTTPEIGDHKSYRLFFSTVSAGQIPMEAENPEEQPFPLAAEENNRYLPYLLYQIRWGIIPISVLHPLNKTAARWLDLRFFTLSV